MQRRLVLVAFVLTAAACQKPPPKAASAAPASAARRPVAPPPVLASACSAEPATVYGQEPVVFRVAAPSATEVEVTLVDEQLRHVAQSKVAAPGTFQPANVPSGDFELRVGPSSVSCAVTVNRELSRASQPAR